MVRRCRGGRERRLDRRLSLRRRWLAWRHLTCWRWLTRRRLHGSWLAWRRLRMVDRLGHESGGVLLHAADCRTEVPESLPERAPYFRQPFRAEHHESHHENQQQVRWLKDVADHRSSLPGRLHGLSRSRRRHAVPVGWAGVAAGTAWFDRSPRAGGSRCTCGSGGRPAFRSGGASRSGRACRGPAWRSGGASRPSRSGALARARIAGRGCAGRRPASGDEAPLRLAPR